jgi:hypothetical protein
VPRSMVVRSEGDAAVKSKHPMEKANHKYAIFSMYYKNNFEYIRTVHVARLLAGISYLVICFSTTSIAPPS